MTPLDILRKLTTSQAFLEGEEKQKEGEEKQREGAREEKRTWKGTVI
jgi:hypothetical protein